MVLGDEVENPGVLKTSREELAGNPEVRIVHCMVVDNAEPQVSIACVDQLDMGVPICRPFLVAADAGLEDIAVEVEVARAHKVQQRAAFGQV